MSSTNTETTTADSNNEETTKQPNIYNFIKGVEIPGGWS